jgi:hypothetical protein
MTTLSFWLLQYPSGLAHHKDEMLLNESDLISVGMIDGAEALETPEAFDCKSQLLLPRDEPVVMGSVVMGLVNSTPGRQPNASRGTDVGKAKSPGSAMPTVLVVNGAYRGEGV